MMPVIIDHDGHYHKSWTDIVGWGVCCFVSLTREKVISSGTRSLSTVYVGRKRGIQLASSSIISQTPRIPCLAVQKARGVGARGLGLEALAALRCPSCKRK
eukprot:scaffold8374_cov175-Amphora_coffeaeformis.AAC.99